MGKRDWNLLIFLTCMFAILCAVLVVRSFAEPATYIDVSARMEEQRKIQETSHTMANCARELGHPEIVTAAQKHWYDAQDTLSALQKLGAYTTRERDLLASVVMQEAPYCTAEHQEYVAQVVLNRVADSRFPDSVERVVFQSGQYPGIHVYSSISDAAYAAAEKAMMGLVDMPADVVWQAQFEQGAAVWKAVSVDTGYFKSTTYFCR